MKRTSPVPVRLKLLYAALAIAVLVAGLPLRALAAPGDITTVAGTGTYGPPGNGGPPASAALQQPDGVAGAPGKLFISEQGNPYDQSSNDVRVVQNGVINIFAGGTIPPSNDGAPATQASISRPLAVIADQAGNLYITDWDRSTIRRVDAATGIITTVAGTASCGNALYTCSSGFAGDGGPATKALLNTPSGLALDKAGNLYIADRDNSRVRKVDASTGVITTVAGGGSPADGLGDNGPATSAQLGLPEGLAVDSAGNLFIGDLNNRVRRVDATTGIITTVAGEGGYGFAGDGGSATAAQLASPGDVSVDSAGDVFIADSGNCRIRKVDASGVISTVAGSAQCGQGGDGGQATSATIGYAGGVRVNAAGELFIADGDIRKVDAHGIISTIAGNGTHGTSGDGGPATKAETDAAGLDLDSAGNVFFPEQSSSRVRRVDAATGIITTVAGGGVGDGLPATSAALSGPRGLATDSSSNLYIADCGDGRVRKVDSSGVMTSVAGGLGEHGLGDGGPATSAALQCPAGVTFGGGAMYIADATDNRVRKVDSSGVISTVAGTGMAGFSGDGGPATAAQLNTPSGVAVDSAGNVYIADLNNNRVRKVDTHGVISTYAGNGASGGGLEGVAATSTPITWPSGLAIAPGGALVIAESGFARVREVNAQGVISTIAGNGIPGYSGDGGPGTSATLDSPRALAYDPSGNLLIADTNNAVIRSVAAGTPPPPPPVTKKTANCGITITQNLTLSSDIGPCPGDGVIIGADGVHLNLNGHTISGSFSHGGNSVGVRATGRQKLDISNGSVTGFDAGVALINGGGNTVRGMTVANNVGNTANSYNSTFGDGILMFSSGGNTVAGNTVAGNGPFDGIAMIGFGADNNLIQNNTVKDTTNTNRPYAPGLGLGITTNPFLGFDRPRTVSVYNNQIVGNVVSNNASAGISTVSNVGGVIRSNIAVHNGYGSPFGFAYPGNGIGVTHLSRATPDTDVVVENNQSINNRISGVDIYGLNNQILSNKADGNGIYDFIDENRDPNNNNMRDCYTNTWSGNQWGTGGISPTCAGAGGSQLPGGTTLPVAPEGPIPQGLGDPPVRMSP